MIRKLDIENMRHAFPEVAFSEDYIIATYQAKVATSNIEKLALAIADEQTTGTWIKVGRDSDAKTKNFGAKLVSIYQVPDIMLYEPDETPIYLIQVAYPSSIATTSMAHLMTLLFGNISASGMIKLMDVAFPKSFIEKFQGPKFGLPGLRELLDIPDRPLLNAMIKPNIGWTPDEGAEIFYEAAKGGVDIIKDDELMLADGDFCPLEDRVKKFMAMEKRAFEETGEHTLYAVSITGGTEDVKKNAYRVLEYGGNCLMLNAYTAGFDTLKMLADDPNINVPILAHSDFAGAMSAGTYVGISTSFLMGKWVRLAGGDLQIGGNPWGKFPIPYKAFYRTFKFFTQPWWHIKPMGYCCAGGTTPMSVADTVKNVGTDVIISAGGGVHGHPDGSEFGARSMRQAIDAAVAGESLVEYAVKHKCKELMAWKKTLDPDMLKNFDLRN